MLFAIKAEISNPRAATFAFIAARLPAAVTGGLWQWMKRAVE